MLVVMSVVWLTLSDQIQMRTMVTEELPVRDRIIGDIAIVNSLTIFPAPMPGDTSHLNH